MNVSLLSLRRTFDVVENEDNYVCFCVEALPTMLVSTSVWPQQLFLKKPLH